MINKLKTIFKNYNILDREIYYLLSYKKRTIYLYKESIRYDYTIKNHYKVEEDLFYKDKIYYNDNIGVMKYYKENKLDEIIFDIKLSYLLSLIRKRKIKLLKNRND